MKIPPVAPIFPAIFPKDKEEETQKETPFKVGDMVKEHTKYSKHRKGIIISKRSHYWLTVKWLNGDNNTILSIYDVTKIKRGDTK